MSLNIVGQNQTTSMLHLCLPGRIARGSAEFMEGWRFSPDKSEITYGSYDAPAQPLPKFLKTKKDKLRVDVGISKFAGEITNPGR